ATTPRATRSRVACWRSISSRASTKSCAKLIGAGNYRLHKQLGQLSLLLVALMLILGYLVIRGAYANPEFKILGLTPAGSTIFPTSDLFFFVIAYVMGISFRTLSAAHKRFMCIAGLLILDPAVFRFILFGVEWPLWMADVIEASLFASLIVYDFIKLKRPHWASLMGIGLFIAMKYVRMTQGSEEWWLSLAPWIFG
ncbi:MAG: hypothetical protein AAF431_18390, partial [Pseudomonadota bacterium]